jgi:hypothetical protein
VTEKFVFLRATFLFSKAAKQKRKRRKKKKQITSKEKNIE